jgi:hypothetical protein
VRKGNVVRDGQCPGGGCVHKPEDAEPSGGGSESGGDDEDGGGAGASGSSSASRGGGGGKAGKAGKGSGKGGSGKAGSKKGASSGDDKAGPKTHCRVRGAGRGRERLRERAALKRAPAPPRAAPLCTLALQARVFPPSPPPTLAPPSQPPPPTPTPIPQVDNYGSLDQGAWRGTTMGACDSQTVLLPTGDLACPR